GSRRAGRLRTWSDIRGCVRRVIGRRGRLLPDQDQDAAGLHVHAVFGVQVGPGLPVPEGVHGDVPLLTDRGTGQPELDRLVVAVEQDQEGVVGDQVAFLIWFGDGLAVQEHADRAGLVPVPVA